MKKTSRRNFGKQLAGALAAIPVASVVKSVGGQVRKKTNGDTPITVGGGGGTGTDPRVRSLYTYVRFNHAYYTTTTPANQDEKHYKHDGDQAYYFVFDDGLGNQNSVKNLTRYLGDDTVEIKLGDGKKIKITQSPGLGVKLKKSEFNDPVGTSDEHIRPGGTSKVTIEFKGSGHKEKDLPVGLWTICVSKDPMGGGCVTPP